MAENKNNESKPRPDNEGRKFNLNKGSGRKFDLDKGGGRKFDLNKGGDDVAPKQAAVTQPKPVQAAKSQTAQETKSNVEAHAGSHTAHAAPSDAGATPTTAQPVERQNTLEPQSADNGDGGVTSGKAKWIIAAIVCLALIAGAWYFSKGKNSSDEVAKTEQPAAESDSTGNVSDSTGNVSGMATQGAGADGAAPKSNRASSAEQETGGAAAPAANATTPASVKKAEPVSSKKHAAEARSLDQEAASSSIPASVDQAAQEVLSGKYGNNPERRRLLGKRYKEIQHAVNQLYRSGKVR